MEIKIAVFYDNIQFKDRIEYVFHNIFSHYYLKNYNINLEFNPNHDNFDRKIYYNNEKVNKRNSINIIPQKIIFSNKIYSSILQTNKYIHEDMTLFSVEKKINNNKNFINQNNILNFDIVETIFYHLSRYEEFYAKDEQLDHHQRMKSNEQFLVINKLEKIPVVDYIIYAFLDFLDFKNLQINTVYSVTHDIDAIRKFPSFYKFLRASARIIIKEKNLNKLMKLLKQYITTRISKNDPYDTFSWLLPYNYSSEKIIYFMSGGKTIYDNFYSVKDKKLKYIFQLVKENNYTIGLHPSYATPFDIEQFKEEITKLEKYANVKVKNTRQHILHFYFKDTISILEDLDIKYDSSLGYQDLVGFRCGIGHDFYLYNFKKERISSVKEIPLVVMDGPLLMESQYEVDKAQKNVFNFLEKNKLYSKITFNFHNSTFDGLVCDYQELIKLYKELNQYFQVSLDDN